MSGAFVSFSLYPWMTITIINNWLLLVGFIVYSCYCCKLAFWIFVLIVIYLNNFPLYLKSTPTFTILMLWLLHLLCWVTYLRNDISKYNRFRDYKGHWRQLKLCEYGIVIYGMRESGIPMLDKVGRGGGWQGRLPRTLVGSVLPVLNFHNLYNLIRFDSSLGCLTHWVYK